MPGECSSSSNRTEVKLELAEDDRPPATLTIEEYYSHLWRPDCDFVDGRSEERNVGILNQQIVITAIMVTTNDKRDEWRALMLPSLRLRVSPTRVRVADLCLISDDAPHEQVPTHPPILVIEVLDEEDRYCATMEKLDDYERFGVEYIWLVDPRAAKGLPVQRRECGEGANGKACGAGNADPCGSWRDVCGIG